MASAEIQVPAGFGHKLQDLCHDMRQPVASVFALAAAALAEPGLPQAACTRMEQIIKQAEWLSELIQHALHAAPASPAGGMSDLVDVAREAVAAECMTWAGEVRILAAAWPAITAVHPVQLHRMIANLLGNAMRAAGPSGRVTLKVSQQQGRARLCVEDTGPGFGKIPRGPGLGLAAVLREVTAHGGTLDCGDAQGGGARVCLTLPLAAAQGPAPAARAEAPARLT